jgi:hypothetical protein
MNDPITSIYIIDCHGLREIVKTKSNSLRSLCLGFLEQGIIAVPTCVWDEFKDAYDDEAESIANSIAKKISMNKRYNAGAARVADRLNSGFSASAADSTTDFFAASIAMTDGFTLITTSDQVPFYNKVKTCKTIDIASLSYE